MKIACVKRDPVYSPNMEMKDLAIFNDVVSDLKEAGYTPVIYTEKEFVRESEVPEVIVNQCRTQAAIDRLKSLEDEGSLVVNSGYGIENCRRYNLTEIFDTYGIPSPETLTVDLKEDISELPEILREEVSVAQDGWWVKNGDDATSGPQDVEYCEDFSGVVSALEQYRERRIEKAVISRHLNGDLIKFYGTHPSGFLYWFYPALTGHGKFGNESINGEPKRYPFDLNDLADIGFRLSKILDVKIFGGDCIVDESGHIKIIDFNDWPSFSIIRKQASHYIARVIDDSLKKWRAKR